MWLSTIKSSGDSNIDFYLYSMSIYATHIIVIQIYHNLAHLKEGKWKFTGSGTK